MTARSKLKNFAPKILLCAGLALLTIRNTNIVTDSMPIINISPSILVAPITLFTKILTLDRLNRKLSVTQG